MLEADRHRDLRLDPRPGGANLRMATIGRSEIASAITDFALFLSKSATTGAFDVVALLSLAEERNLFCRDLGWNATYVPVHALAAPFRLSGTSPTGLTIDREDTRLGAAGEALFDASGAAAPRLIAERERLERFVADVEAARVMTARWVKLGLVEPITLALTLADGTMHELDGLYVLDHDAMASLDDRDILDLYRSGDLAAASLMTASLGQIERLRQLSERSGRPVAAIAVRGEDVRLV